jgi:hypothetical protein
MIKPMPMQLEPMPRQSITVNANLTESNPPEMDANDDPLDRDSEFEAYLELEDEI